MFAAAGCIVPQLSPIGIRQLLHPERSLAICHPNCGYAASTS
jgi:hypothetical protein